MPTRPVRYIAPAIVIVVLSLYYWEQYNKCNDIKTFRTQLTEELISKSVTEKFRLVDFTDFVWDKVRIVTSIRPGERNVECPFGWNWGDGQRESLMASGLLTVLMFGNGESIVGYAELRSDEVEFGSVERSLTPETAVFSVNKSNTGNGVSLTLQN